MVQVKLVVTTEKGAREIPLDEVKPTKNFLKFKTGDFDGADRQVVASVYLATEVFK